MSDSNIRDELKPTGADVAYTITKAGLTLIPVVGGAAAEIFSAIKSPPLIKRMEEWLITLDEGLRRLEILR